MINTNSRKMEVLMGFGIPAIVQIDSKTAIMKLPPSWECMIDVSSPSYTWEAKTKDVVCNWQDSTAVPDDVMENIGKVAKRYNEALMDLIDEGV